MNEMFNDKNGKLSPKRILGVICVIAGLIFTGLKIGDPDLVKYLFITGFAAMSITVLEKKD